MYLEARNRARETKLEEKVTRQVTDYVGASAATPKGKGKDKNTPIRGKARRRIKAKVHLKAKGRTLK
eukprot:3894391-Amphidinium_carterae.1